MREAAAAQVLRRSPDLPAQGPLLGGACHARSLPCPALPCRVLPRHAFIRHAMPFYVCTTLCHAAPCHAMPRHAMPCRPTASICSLPSPGS